MTNTNQTLLLTGREVSQLMSVQDYIDAVEDAFRVHGQGRSLRPDMMHVDCTDGEFHIKAGGLKLGSWYFGLKINGDFPQNPTRFRMPGIQGLILIASGDSGLPLAIVESREITIGRTAAATALAVKYLARPGSKRLTICGCGIQARIHLRTLAHIFSISNAFVFGRDLGRAQKFADEMSSELAFPISATADLHAALKVSDVCVTCTRSKEYFLRKEYVSPGSFIAAVGADSPTKQELDPELLKYSTVVTDITSQCLKVGELHHACNAGMRQDDIYAELSEIVAGKKPGRRSAEEIIIFDSTGTALQDVAAAAAVYRKALEASAGTKFSFFG